MKDVAETVLSMATSDNLAPVTSSASEKPASLRYGQLAALFVCVLLMGMAIMWVFLSMRAVMDIGGSCATGGPYQVATPCPDNVAVLLTLGIPLMMICAFVGTLAGPTRAPGLLLPMWALLFGALGWNFLEYGIFGGDVVWSWLLCGLLFQLMAAPAALALFPCGRNLIVGLDPGSAGGTRWLLGYAVLVAGGAILGYATFRAWA